MKFGVGWVLIASAALLAGCRDDAGEGPMRPGVRYLGNAFGDDAATVVFEPDGRILELDVDPRKPLVAGEWLRKDGQFCIVEDPEFSTLCLQEEPFGQGGFALVHEGRQLEFTPLAD